MRISKYQERLLRKQLPKAGDGLGRFIYENNSGTDLLLPGRTGRLRFDAKTRKGDQFEGTDYYKQFVGKGLKIVKTLEPPVRKLQENTMSEKLITEQPPTVTNQGKVEFVEEKGKKLNETPEMDEVLLNESPVDDSGVEII